MDRLKRKLNLIRRSSKDKNNYIPTKTGNAIASICSSLIPTIGTIRSINQIKARMIQNYLLVWLDVNSNDHHTHNYRDTVTLLRHIINSVHTFTELNQCVEFIKTIDDEKIFLIISGMLSHIVTSNVHDFEQIYSIYLISEDKLEHDMWIHRWPKIKGIFMDVSVLCDALKQAAHRCDQNMLSMSFINFNEKQFDEKFLEIFILKEILTKLPLKSMDIKEFTGFYRKLISGNLLEERNLDKFEREYHDDGPIWWYTSSSFFFSLLNHALHSIDIETLMKMSFFIRDLHQQITQLYLTQNHIRTNTNGPLIVYRGQGLSQTHFEQFQTRQNQYVAFNNFLLASKVRQVSLNFACQSTVQTNLYGVLFVITIDSSIPYANIRDLTCNQIDEDILVTIQPIFRIGEIKPITNRNTRLWQIDLTLMNRNDSQIDMIQDETFANRNGWCRWSDFLIVRNHFDRAQQICEFALNQTSNDNERASINYQLGLIKFQQQDYSNALTFYKSSLDTRLQNHLHHDLADIATCYNEIGLVYEKLNEYSKAIETLERALAIYEKILPMNDILLAECNNSLARIYYQSGQYKKSISSYEKVLDSYRQSQPVKYKEMSTIYSNIGSVYEKINEFKQAIDSFEQSLKILKENFPCEQLEMATLYNHIASTYEKLKEYSIAITYYEKSLEIYEEHHSSDHIDFATLYQNIGLIYFERYNYINALNYLEKSLDIYRKVLPFNHPDLAAAYICQGAIYEEMSKYPKALSYYKKALEIYQQIQPIDFLNLATVYNNLGSVHFQMNEYSIALSYHGKALEIYQKHLPLIHSDTANSHSWHGDIYDKLGDHTNALISYEKALNIGRVCLPSNHSCLKQWTDNIERIKTKNLSAI